MQRQSILITQEPGTGWYQIIKMKLHGRKVLNTVKSLDRAVRLASVARRVQTIEESIPAVVSDPHDEWELEH